MARIFPCLALAAACCCCLALLPPPVQAAGRHTGMQAAGGRRLHLRPRPVPMPEPRFFFVPSPAEEEGRRSGVPPVMTTTKARRPEAAWSVRPELRAVPGGPDPLHHHGGSPSRRPEQDHRTPRSP